MGIRSFSATIGCTLFILLFCADLVFAALSGSALYGGDLKSLGPFCGSIAFGAILFLFGWWMKKDTDA